MIRNIKALGLALVAVLAMSAVAASASQAATSGFDVGLSPAVLKGTILPGTEHTLVVGTAVVKCAEANIEGTVAGTVAEPKNVHEATATATYAKCKFGGTAAEVRMNGCKYTLTDTLTSLTAEVDITGCTSGKWIEIISLVTNCSITVKEQGPLSHVVGENVVGTSPTHVVLNATVKNIHAIFDGSECPGTGEVANAEFNGKTTVKAFKDDGTEAEKEEFKHKFLPLKAITQTSLEAT
ncbi:MAG TPA: hypothetical protein VGO13_07285 [Solirubrobacterales bacterium]|jgi:hypothetical protein|nr:hypothetical protein [Solirubrobacterales bacterium]